MEKKIYLFLAAAIVAISVVAGAVAASRNAAPQAPETPRHLDPRVVAIGKELPRGDVVSHDSKADAVRRTFGASKYMQPLDRWTRSESAEAVTYRTRFKIPFEWIDRRQFLCLGRVSGSFDVVINGTPAAYSQTGSTPSEFDITDASKEGANELEIVIYKNPVAHKLENSRPPAPPRIEGEVYILSQPTVRVRDVSISTRMEGTSGLLELGVILKSHRLNPRDYTVYWELLNPAGEILAEGSKDARLDMRREDTVRFFANIPRVVPWSHEDPRLYTLFVKTQNEGRFREYISFRVGFRSLSLTDDGGLALNGVPLGLAMREFSPAGDVVEMRKAVERMRAEGVNALMLRGAPPSREFFALCDSMGVYLSCRADIDTHLSGEERTVGGNPSNDPAWKEAYLDRTTGMYHTSKNHPSVSMFSLAERSANGYNLYESYVALKALEPYRPVLYADGEGEWNSDRLGLSDSPTERRPSPQAVEASREGGNSDRLGTSVSPTERRSSPQASAAPTSVDRPTLEAVDVAKGMFRVSNPRRITPLAGEAIYKVMVGRKMVSSGSVPIEVLPGGTTDFTVPIAGVKEGKAYTVSIEIAGERADGDYLPRSRNASTTFGDGRRSLGETLPRSRNASTTFGDGRRSLGETLSDPDPNLKVFRRLDLPLPESARTAIVAGEFPVGK